MIEPNRVVGYLLFLPDGAIRFRTGEPDFSSLKDQEYDWTRSVYSGACEQIPHDINKPLGKHVQTTHYVDANLHHDLATGKAVTAALHFLNQTPIYAYTKRQSTVETATYGSEFVAARTAVDQIIDIRTTLRYLGAPIRNKSYMLGDNRSVVTSSTIPNSTISKRHHLAIESGKQLQLNTSHSIGKMAKATLLISSANIGSLQQCGPCSRLSCSGGARLPPSLRGVTEFRQPLQVQSHLEMPGILVQLSHIQRT